MSYKVIKSNKLDIDALNKMIHQNDIENVRRMISDIDNLLEFDQYDQYGDTPLVDASSDIRRKDIILLLLNSGADVNAPSQDGDTPLFRATSQREEEVVKILLSAGANPNIVNNNGISPLLIISTYGFPTIVETLLIAGADPNIPDNINITPLYAASEHGYVEIVKMLLAVGANPNTITKSAIFTNIRITPLLIASRNNHTKIVKLLLEAGANPYLVDELTSAEEDKTEHPEIFELFKNLNLLDRKTPLDFAIEIMKEDGNDIFVREYYRRTRKYEIGSKLY